MSTIYTNQLYLNILIEFSKNSTINHCWNICSHSGKPQCLWPFSKDNATPKNCDLLYCIQPWSLLLQAFFCDFKWDIITSKIQIIFQIFVNGQSWRIMHREPQCPIRLCAMMKNVLYVSCLSLATEHLKCGLWNWGTHFQILFNSTNWNGNGLMRQVDTTLESVGLEPSHSESDLRPSRTTITLQGSLVEMQIQDTLHQNTCEQFLQLSWVKSLWLYLWKHSISTNTTKLDNELTSKYPDVWHYVSKIYSPIPTSCENLPPLVWHHVSSSMSFKPAYG